MTAEGPRQRPSSDLSLGLPSPHLSLRGDRALTVGGRAPPRSARRRAPSSSAGTLRRSSIAEN